MLPQTVNAYYNPGTNEICFPAGHPAEAVLQPRRPAGRELRRHRRGDRPRDRPRLRRPGRAVRRRRQPQRLVDAGRQGGVRGEVARRSSTQYDGFEPRDLPGEHVNGALTVGENIGDLGGLTIGHKAFLITPAAARRASRTGEKLFLNWAYVLAHQAAHRAGAAVPHHRPAQPAGVPRQHRAQPRRVPRGLRHRRGRRALARPRRTASGSGERRALGQSRYAASRPRRRVVCVRRRRQASRARGRPAGRARRVRSLGSRQSRWAARPRPRTCGVAGCTCSARGHRQCPAPAYHAAGTSRRSPTARLRSAEDPGGGRGRLDLPRRGRPARRHGAGRSQLLAAVRGRRCSWSARRGEGGFRGLRLSGHGRAGRARHAPAR